MSNETEKKVHFFDREYQLKLFSRIFYNTEFGDEVIFDLDQSLFDEIYIKKICIAIKNYFNKYGVMPNISNIRQIETDDPSISEIERNVILSYLSSMSNYKKQVEENIQKNDYEYIEQTFFGFLATQKIKNLANEITDALTFSDMPKVHGLIDKLMDAREIGTKKDNGFNVAEIYKNAIRNPLHECFPTGIYFIDKAVGGLPRGMLGLIMAPTGVGKSTVLAYISEYAHSQNKYVLHIIFDENTVNDTSNKFSAKWSGIPTDDFKKNEDLVIKKVEEVLEKRNGKIIIKNFQSEGVTVPKIRNFILNYQKKFGIKFDIVCIDYMDELESHKLRVNTEWDGQVHVTKALKSLATELYIPIWSAIQTQKEDKLKGVKFLDKSHAGGSYARLKKSQLVIGAMHEDKPQQARGCANFSIVKCNFAKSANVWYECVLNNELLIINEGKLSNDTVINYDEDELARMQEAKYDKVETLNNNTAAVEEKLSEH